MHTNKNTISNNLIINALKGFGVSLLTSFCMSFLVSLILYLSSDPLSYLKTGIIITVFLSYIVGSLFASHKCTSPIASTVMSSAMHAVIMLLIAIILPNDNITYSLTSTLLVYIGAPITSICLILFLNKTKTNNKRKRPKKYRG